MRTSMRLRMTCAVLLALSATVCVAQVEPARALRVVVPYPPGGSSDLQARLVAQGLGERLGQSMVIDNVAGAGGVVGTAKVARAAPDGYTLLVAPDSTIVIAP